MASEGTFSTASRRPRPAALAAIALLHLVAIYALARALAPQAITSVERAVLSSVTVTVETKQVTPPPEPEVEPDPEPAAASGASGEAGRKAIPREVVAPVPKVVVKPAPPAPRASSTGSANRSGARDAGSGTGAGGGGEGTGSGASGSGSGNGVAGRAPTQPQLLSGAINAVRDYPMPPGGYSARRGTEVIVRVTVGTDGRATDCRVYRASPDAEADAITCRLVEQRLRFRPATDASGSPVAAPFLWRQRWF